VQLVMVSEQSSWPEIPPPSRALFSLKTQLEIVGEQNDPKSTPPPPPSVSFCVKEQLVIAGEQL